MDPPLYSSDHLPWAISYHFHFDIQLPFSMIAEMKAANALGARTARACDSCLRRKARWFCAADDAFLCQGCDNLVHSANQLASRHERVRLHTASSELNSSVTPQAWHSGFTRKARTPRHNKHLLVKQERISKDEEEFFNTLPVVPDLGNNEEPLLDETEEQLLYRVPVFDPFDILETTMKPDVGDDVEETHDLDNFSEFLPSDVDLAEFVADVENLLGSAGLDEDSGEMKGPELFDCKEDEDKRPMKVKDEQLEANTAFHLEPVLGITRQEEEEKLVVPVAANDSVSENKIFLRLNYEEVISAWDSQGCPWTTGNPPHFNSHDCLGSSGGDIGCYYGDVGSLRGGIVDGGREARVSRYREKRRTRLFAKKIRYEVRKLNAEKRPRMKGRFVKRTSFVEGTSFPAYH